MPGIGPRWTRSSATAPAGRGTLPSASPSRAADDRARTLALLVAGMVVAPPAEGREATPPARGRHAIGTGARRRGRLAAPRTTRGERHGHRHRARRRPADRGCRPPARAAGARLDLPRE